MKKSKKNKVNYNFPKETCELIAERDGNECLFCKMQYHMDKCRSEMLLGIPDIMHYINKSQGGLGIEENGVLGCRYHHGLLDNGNLGLRPEMLEIMKEHLMQQYRAIGTPKKIKDLLEKAAEEIENLYGRETQLSEEIRKSLDS